MSEESLLSLPPERRRVEFEKQRRALLYAALNADKNRLLLYLARWEKDPVAFINDCSWTMDEKQFFGGGMVPLRLYPKQELLIRRLCEVIEYRNPQYPTMPARQDFVDVKSRQVGWTAIVVSGLVKWYWLFRKGCNALLTSYDEDVIDGGGKGKRGFTSLFGRIRASLDEWMAKLPALRFNQDKAAQTRRQE